MGSADSLPAPFPAWPRVAITVYSWLRLTRPWVARYWWQDSKKLCDTTGQNSRSPQIVGQTELSVLKATSISRGFGWKAPVQSGHLHVPTHVSKSASSCRPGQIPRLFSTRLNPEHGRSTLT